MPICLTSAKKAGRYYIPWSRKSPIIVRSPDHMQELSEAPELSQRAVYADVSVAAQTSD